MPRHFSVDGQVSIDVPESWVSQRDTSLVESFEAQGNDLAPTLRRLSDGQIGPFSVDHAHLSRPTIAACVVSDVASASPAPLEALMREAFRSATIAEEEGASRDSVFVRDSREFITDGGLLGGATSVDYAVPGQEHSAINVQVRLTPEKQLMLATLGGYSFPTAAFTAFVRVAQTIRVHAP